MNPVGQWNQGELIVDGNSVQHWLNGKLALSYNLESKELIFSKKTSKFKTFDWYGRKKAGHILIQAHGEIVHFRRIYIQEL